MWYKFYTYNTDHLHKHCAKMLFQLKLLLNLLTQLQNT